MKPHQKKPVIALAPPSGKRPRFNVNDPTIDAARRPCWRIQYVDKGGPFAWTKIEPGDLLTVLGALANYETMNWTDIEARKSCHKMPTASVSKEARQRLDEIELDDVEDLYQLQVNNRFRVFGMRDRNIFYVLWWDPEHQVYPTQKRNT